MSDNEEPSCCFCFNKKKKKLKGNINKDQTGTSQNIRDNLLGRQATEGDTPADRSPAAAGSRYEVAEVAAAQAANRVSSPPRDSNQSVSAPPENRSIPVGKTDAHNATSSMGSQTSHQADGFSLERESINQANRGGARLSTNHAGDSESRNRPVQARYQTDGAFPAAANRLPRTSQNPVPQTSSTGTETALATPSQTSFESSPFTTPRPFTDTGEDFKRDSADGPGSESYSTASLSASGTFYSLDRTSVASELMFSVAGANARESFTSVSSYCTAQQLSSASSFTSAFSVQTFLSARSRASSAASPSIQPSPLLHPPPLSRPLTPAAGAPAAAFAGATATELGGCTNAPLSRRHSDGLTSVNKGSSWSSPGDENRSSAVLLPLHRRHSVCSRPSLELSPPLLFFASHSGRGTTTDQEVPFPAAQDPELAGQLVPAPAPSEEEGQNTVSNPMQNVSSMALDDGSAHGQAVTSDTDADPGAGPDTGKKTTNASNLPLEGFSERDKSSDTTSSDEKKGDSTSISKLKLRKPSENLLPEPSSSTSPPCVHHSRDELARAHSDDASACRTNPQEKYRHADGASIQVSKTSPSEVHSGPRCEVHDVRNDVMTTFSLQTDETHISPLFDEHKDLDPDRAEDGKQGEETPQGHRDLVEEEVGAEEAASAAPPMLKLTSWPFCCRVFQVLLEGSRQTGLSLEDVISELAEGLVEQSAAAAALAEAKRLAGKPGLAQVAMTETWAKGRSRGSAATDCDGDEGDRCGECPAGGCAVSSAAKVVGDGRGSFSAEHGVSKEDDGASPRPAADPSPASPSSPSGGLPSPPSGSRDRDGPGGASCSVPANVSPTASTSERRSVVFSSENCDAFGAQLSLPLSLSSTGGCAGGSVPQTRDDDGVGDSFGRQGGDDASPSRVPSDERVRNERARKSESRRRVTLLDAEKRSALERVHEDFQKILTAARREVGGAGKQPAGVAVLAQELQAELEGRLSGAGAPSPASPWLLLACRSFQASLEDTASDEGWKVCLDNNGLKMMYQHEPGSQVHGFRARCDIDAPAEHLLAVTREIDLVPKWNKYCTGGQVVRELNPAALVAFLSLWMPWPMRDISMTVEAVGADLLDTEKCVLITFATRNLMAAAGARDGGGGSSKKSFRVNVLAPSSFSLEPVPMPPDENGRIRHRTRCCLQLYVDPGMKVPSGIVTFVIKVLAPFVYNAVRKLMQEMFLDPENELPQRLGARPELYGLVRRRRQQFLDPGQQQQEEEEGKEEKRKNGAKGHHGWQWPRG